ncbi:RbsD/FucU family protein [Thalassovita aquimarina]|uniref:Ribose ABC transporter n=1 Tax=Thalassovita aquimarina TaxID=2785917 RepID=A0ABS5HVM2_9RHOB|nr:RbsD/FucU domain-containing protein [Thalassovita aquimarina]MBR9653003.1 ribose ABC transporter [Thalassovita aquimarina]
MLKGIDSRMPADLLDVLMRMGHGDEIAVVDCNYPAHSSAAGTVTGRVIELPGFSAPEAIEMVCTLMPLDPFVPEGALWMEVDGKGAQPNPVHEEAIAILAREMPEGGGVGAIARQDFYARARQGFAVLRCTETRGYGCFILRKGVIL